MNKFIYIKTPKGGSVSLDLNDFKRAKIIAESNKLIIDRVKESSFTIPGEQLEIEKILKDIISAKNEYERYLQENILKEDLKENLIKEFLAISKEAISKVSITPVSTALKMSKESIDNVTESNNEINRKIQELQQNIKETENIVKLFKKEVSSLKETIFSEE